MSQNEGDGDAKSKDDTIKLYLCPYCKKLFTSKQELGRHISRECPKRDRPPDKPSAGSDG